jgi:hypothetical protein
MTPNPQVRQGGKKQRRSADGYPPTKFAGSIARSMCMWSGCNTFATTEVREGWWGDGRSWRAMCPPHRRAFDLLGPTALKAIRWQRPRKRVA